MEILSVSKDNLVHSSENTIETLLRKSSDLFRIFFNLILETIHYMVILSVPKDI